METPDKILIAAERLKQGHRINRITVRDFLRHFGAERRGAAKVEAIRRILDSLELRTEPDFETAWIDGLIWLRLKDDVLNGPSDSALPDGTAGQQLNGDLEEIILESTPSAVQQAEEQAESAPMSTEPETPKNPIRLNMFPMSIPLLESAACPPQTRSLSPSIRTTHLRRQSP
jgi:hypothetical protein